MNILELKKFRSTQNLSREELAEAIGITIETLNTWEYRTKKIPSDKIERVIYVFNMYKYKHPGLSSNTVSNNLESNENIFIEFKGDQVSLADIDYVVSKNWDLIKNKSDLTRTKIELDIRDGVIDYLKRKKII